MASCSLALTGQITVTPGACGATCAPGCGTAAVAMTTKPITLACGGSFFEGITSTDCPVEVRTDGVAGTAFTDLPSVSGPVDLLYLNTGSSSVILRVNGAVPVLQGVGGAFPVVSTGVEVLNFVVEGTAVDTVLPAGNLTAQQIANAVNASAALAGLSFLPMTVDTTGQLQVSGSATGTDRVVTCSASGLPATGFTAGQSAMGAGEDIPIQGTFLSQFSPAATRLQISGQARVDVLAATKP